MPSGVYPRKSPIERAFDKIKIQSNGCWVWKGVGKKTGYGKLKINGKFVYAHRFFYNFEHPEFPILGKNRKNSLDHLCRNPSCVNPEHLEPVTQRENCTRGKNSILNKNKSSKYVGVYWEKRKEKWHSSIRTGKKSKFLGYYDNEEEAAKAYRNALQEVSS